MCDTGRKVGMMDGIHHPDLSARVAHALPGKKSGMANAVEIFCEYFSFSPIEGPEKYNYPPGLSVYQGV